MGGENLAKKKNRSLGLEFMTKRREYDINFGCCEDCANPLVKKTVSNAARGPSITFSLSKY